MVLRESRSWSGLERVEELQRAVSSILVPLSVVAPVGTPFTAVVDHAAAGTCSVTRIRRTAGSVRRDARLITSSDPDLFKVTLQRRGSLAVTQDGQQNVARPGDLVVFDTSRPYELSGVGPLEVGVFTAPRTMFGAAADLLSDRTAVPVRGDSGLQAAIAAFLSGLADTVEELPGPHDLRLGDAIIALILAAFDAEPVRAVAGSADRILSYALANLGDPALSVEWVARKHGISPRYVHRLLQRRGVSFAAWVRHERLTRIRRDLLDPALSQRTASAIAARWGILDTRHLARAFRREFGYTPADLRRGVADSRSSG